MALPASNSLLESLTRILRIIIPPKIIIRFCLFLVKDFFTDLAASVYEIFFYLNIYKRWKPNKNKKAKVDL